MTNPYKQMPAYLDAHCAAFNGWTIPTASNEVEQQAIDRGHWDGLQARRAAPHEEGVLTGATSFHDALDGRAADDQDLPHHQHQR